MNEEAALALLAKTVPACSSPAEAASTAVELPAAARAALQELALGRSFSVLTRMLAPEQGRARAVQVAAVFERRTAVAGPDGALLLELDVFDAAVSGVLPVERWQAEVRLGQETLSFSLDERARGSSGRGFVGPNYIVSNDLRKGCAEDGLSFRSLGDEMVCWNHNGLQDPDRCRNLESDLRRSWGLIDSDL